MKRVLIVVLLGLSAATFAEGGVLQGSCSSCHNIKGPAAQTLKIAFEKKGPDLFYAGNKYRQEWLVSWLQKPDRIRPAGMYYGGHIKVGAKGDEIDTSTLMNHIALSKADATSVAAELMKMKPHDDLIAKEKIEPGTISMQMGEMAFNKFLGCMACHLIEPEYGGLSGPELYTAAKRLQPQYMASFIRAPQVWEPKSMMPNKNLSDANIQKMVRYLESLSKEAANAN
ncbi:Cytochrome c [Candidatus Nitrotoga sp. BS]|uniref:c-type cytochrome n=1 Tax=Candidatus Nitrotoga sp. BS TaxID=2890408 RepID=UPI001EF39A63|nr:c-type cytochrome [Candidatus Nitrotoga sp. BS]CAH1201104.1 Cytochrome c [Candidatus Nitrotoga sp. BS]